MKWQITFLIAVSFFWSCQPEPEISSEDVLLTYNVEAQSDLVKQYWGKQLIAAIHPTTGQVLDAAEIFPDSTVTLHSDQAADLSHFDILTAYGEIDDQGKPVLAIIDYYQGFQKTDIKRHHSVAGSKMKSLPSIKIMDIDELEATRYKYQLATDAKHLTEFTWEGNAIIFPHQQAGYFSSPVIIIRSSLQDPKKFDYKIIDSVPEVSIVELNNDDWKAATPKVLDIQNAPSFEAGVDGTTKTSQRFFYYTFQSVAGQTQYTVPLIPDVFSAEGLLMRNQESNERIREQAQFRSLDLDQPISFLDSKINIENASFEKFEFSHTGNSADLLLIQHRLFSQTSGQKVTFRLHTNPQVAVKLPNAQWTTATEGILNIPEDITTWDSEATAVTIHDYDSFRGFQDYISHWQGYETIVENRVHRWLRVERGQ